MELQFFDSAGDLRLRLHSHEPVWRVLEAPAPGPVEGPELRELADRLEAEVRRLRESLPDELRAGGYDEATVDVLGETLRINVRNPHYRELLRANDVYRAVKGVLDAGLGLRAIAVPELSREQFRVAQLLKHTADAIPKRALPALVESKLDELRSITTNDATAKALERERGSWDDPGTPERIVAALEASGLVRQDPNGLVRPTEDLRLLVL